MSVLTPFHAAGLFLYPLKTSQNLWFSDVFRGAQKENSGMIWVKKGSLHEFNLTDIMSNEITDPSMSHY